jgi:hypothetical protein
MTNTIKLFITICSGMLDSGSHLTFYNSNYGGGAAIGVDGVLGLDYKLSGTPLNISFDWNLNVNFGSTTGFIADGLGVRYTF